MNKEPIVLIPVGTVDQEIVNLLAHYLQEIFGVPVPVAPSIAILFDAYNARREQYHATAVLKSVRESSQAQEARALGIVDVDLYVPELNFVFGQADRLSKTAIISLVRLREEFYSLPGNSELFVKRAVTEAVHELGHTFNLDHCPDKNCVMYFSNSLADTDRKRATFCSKCKDKVSK